MDDRELLRQYVEHDSEEAFAELVRRHINLVYATALRLVNEPAAAQDVTQRVFIHLVRKAPTVRQLPGWLYRVACDTAKDTLRAERRRHAREVEAVNRSQMSAVTSESSTLAPLLDEAMARLNEKEQNAIVLRFFEGKSLDETSHALSISEDAAQKRISRALEKLRGHFRLRGARVSPGIIASALSIAAGQVAPAGLAATVASAAVATGTSTGFIMAIQTLFMSKTQTALAAALIVSTTAFLWQYQANSQLERRLAAAGATKATAEKSIMAAPAGIAGPAVIMTNVVFEPFDWRRVESADYRQYVANLRAIGCPEQTIRDLVSADLRKNLLDKVQTPERKPVRPFWLNDEQAAQAALNEVMAEGEQLLNQFAASHLQLLGAAPDHVTMETFMNSVLREGAVDAKEALMANWSAELKERVADLEHAHNERVRKSGAGITTGWETSMERMALEGEREAALAAVLPKAELTEYLLRDSVTARAMRHALRGFRPTEEEFRKLFPLQHEFDRQWGAYGSRPSDASRLSQYMDAREQLLGQIQQVLDGSRFSVYRMAMEGRTGDPVDREQQASAPGSQ